MDVPFLLSEAQMRQIEPFSSQSHGVPRVDDRRIVSAIIYVIKHGLMWSDAPKAYGPHKMIYNRCIRWSRLGVFSRIFTELEDKAGEPDRINLQGMAELDRQGAGFENDSLRFSCAPPDRPCVRPQI